MAGSMPSHIGGYEIRKQLGEGAFGRVYLAYDARVNRLVAIKVLLLTDKEVVTRFKNEAIVAGNLRHNNIVTIYEFGEHEGLPFLAMEFLDGQNLQDVIRSKKPLTMLQKISMMTQIADGLDCAHRHGVVHRDVKPANMMLLPDGTVKIMDFGIARLTGAQPATRLTQQGNVLGTLLYMAPEQFAANTEVDALCDIFACGEVFYELLAGRHPFEANEPRILLYKVTVDDPPPLRNFVPDSSPVLEQVLSRMLSKPRELRYHSLREVLFDIQPVLIDLQQERAASLMTQAEELIREQKTDAANALLPEIFELDPGNRAAYRLRDQIQRELLKPKIESLLKTGREELAKRRFHEAMQAFTAAARLDSSNSELHELLTQAKAAQEHSQRAGQLLAEARQALDQQNLAAAYKNASEALFLDPENPQASRLLLVIQSAMERKRQQQQLDEALLKAEHLLMIQAFDKALETLAGLEAAAAADERVEQLATRIRAQKQEHERAERLQAGMSSATEMLREQKLEEAVTHLTSLFAEFPDKADVRQLLEYALKELAAQQRLQAIEKIKSDAQALADAHDFRAALDSLEKGLQQYDDGSLVRLLGTIMAAKSAWEREQAMKAARARAERFRAEGKLTDAIQAAESAIRTHNADPAMTDLLRQLEREWEQAKRDEEIRATVAQARRLLDSGQTEKALRILADAARRFPDSAELQSILTEARQAFAAEATRRELESLARDAHAQAERANFDAALQMLDRGIEKYPAESSLVALRDEIVERKAVVLRRQDVQRAVQDGKRLAAEGRYSEALELVRGALLRYQGEPALVEAEGRLQSDWERRRRELAILEAGTQARALLEQGKPAEAVELLRNALEQYPAARDLESMFARAQRAAAIDQAAREARALLQQRDFDAALKRLEEALRSWPGERSLATLQNEAALGLAGLRREQAIRDSIERSRDLIAQGSPAEALRLADAALRQFPGESGLAEVRRQAQAKVDEAERLRRRTADLDALRRLDHDSRTLTDTTQIRDLGDKVRAIAKTYAGDPEVEAAAGRMLDVLAQMQDASALLSRRDFAGLQKTCERLCAQYPQHVLFQRLESEAARGLRQAAVQELRHKLQTEQDLEARSKLLDEALPLYPEEAWLQQEARAVRGKLALVNTIVEKARAAATAERWDEAIEQWNSLRGLYANYPGLDRELESLTARKQEARAALRARYVQQIREQMASCDYSPAAGLAQRASRDFAGDAELQTLREQIDVAQRAVEDARAAAAKQAFAPAARILETALGRYAGDPLLEREREAIERQAAAREAGITEAMRQSGELADEQDLDDALQTLDAAAQQYGEDPRLADLRRRVQAMRQAREVRSRDLDALNRLQDDARNLTSSAAISGLRQKVRSIAARYAEDVEFARTAAAVERQLEAMQQAGVLLARREYAAVLEICGRYPDQRLLQNLMAEATRGENAARISEARRQVDEEPDLRRQAELLDTALRSFPDEASLRDRVRTVRATLERSDTAVENARRAEEQSRWDEAIALWQQVAGLYKSYPGLDAEIARLEERKQQARAAERERLLDQIRRTIEGGDYDKATAQLELARKQFSGDGEIQALDARVQAVRQVVRQAASLDVRQAIESLEAALKQYPGDTLLGRELESKREEEARQAQLRADAIGQAAEQIGALVAESRLNEALKLAEASLRQYPGETTLLAAQEQARLQQAESLRQEQRRHDLQALGRLEAEARALTAIARIGALQGKAHGIAAPYTDDAEISQPVARLDRLFAAMLETKALLDRQDFAAVFAACAEHGDHPFFARLKAEAERTQRTARIAEVEREVDKETDLMRQIELLDATIRFYPDDPTLLEHSRVVRTKIGQVEAIVESARRAEKAERWDEALAQWSSLADIYKDYPGLAQEIDRVTKLKRERLGDEIWHQVNTGEYDAAADLLAQAYQDFPGDAEMQFLREQVESIRQIVRQARSLPPAQRIDAIETALRQHQGDKLLERELESAREEARRQEQSRQDQHRNDDRETLQALYRQAEAATEAPAVAAIEEQTSRLEAAHPGDQELAQMAAAIRQLCAAIREAQALLDKRDYAAVLSACSAHPDHPFFARLKAQAEHAQRQARIAEVQHKVDAESDLMLQMDLLDATIRIYPDDPSLLERSRTVRSTVSQVEAIVQKARQAEAAAGLDEAVAQWSNLRKVYPDYPGLEQEIERVTRLKRERLRDEIRQLVNAGDYEQAAALLSRGEQDYRDDPELQFLREQVESVRQIVRQARAVPAAQARESVEAALLRYPGDKLLAAELQALREQAERESQIREAKSRVRRLAREGNQETILQFVRESPPHVQQDAEIRELIAAASQTLAERRLHQEVAELTAQARELAQQSRFPEALQLLDRGGRQYPAAAQEIAAARAAVAVAQLTGEVDRLSAKEKYSAALRAIGESGLTGPEIVALRRRVEALATPAQPEPRGGIPKIAWIGGAAAILALLAYGIFTLLHREGTLVVETAAAAVISVDQGPGIAADDKGIVTLHIRSGAHTLTVTKPGFDNAEQRVAVKAGVTDHLTVRLSAPKNALTPTPVIASLDPGSVVNLGAAFTLTIKGSGFDKGTAVKWNGAPLRTTRVRSTQLRAAVPANLVERPGKAVITVVNGTVSSQPVTLPINPSAPAITGLQPASISAGDPGFVLRVTGSGFQPGATVDWAKTRLSTTVERANSIRAAVPAKLIAKPGSVPVAVVNPGDVASSPVSFTVNSLTPMPAVSGLNPATVTAGGATFSLTISGANFVQGAAVHWNGTALITAFSGPTQLHVQVPANLIANAGNVRLTVVNPGNVASPEVNFSITAPVPAPVISTLAPSSAATGSPVSLTVNGGNFQSGATVEWNRTPVQTTFSSPTQLRATVPANLLSAPGSATVVVMNPGNVTSAPATFTVNAPAAAPAPAISSLNPSTATAGGPQFIVTVSGSNFAQGVSVRWNRSPLSIVSSSGTQLRATVPANLIGSPGAASVTVMNPDGVSSGAVNFTITQPSVPTPAISSLSPNSTPAGGPGFILTINGSGFQQGATVHWNRTPLAATVNNAGQLTAQIGANLIASPGSASVTVQNGNIASSPSVFSISSPQNSVNADVESIKSVLAEYAEAVSQKNLRKATALFPLMPKEFQNTLQDFGRDYSLQYTIEVTAPPVVRGDDATVSARTVTRTKSGRRVSDPVTKSVVFTLHRGGGQWTITGLR